MVTGTRSVILGGQNITGATDDTVYVPNLNINTIPISSSTLTQILVRDDISGDIKKYLPDVKFKHILIHAPLYTLFQNIDTRNKKKKDDLADSYLQGLYYIEKNELRCADLEASKKMSKYIEKLRFQEGDSTGAIIEIIIQK